MYFKLQILLALLRLKYNKWRYRNNLERLREKQWKKLQKNLSKSSFYREMAEKNITLQDFPLMNKAKFMANFDAINTVNITADQAMKVAEQAERDRDFSPEVNGITIGLSSGTSGNRGIFLASKKERANWVACVLDRVIGFSLKKRKVAFFLRANSNLYSSVSSKLLQFEFFDILGQLDQYIGRLNTLQPTILVAQPSILLALAKWIENGQLRISPTKILSVAEVLTPEDAAYLEQVFQQTIHQVYQCTEGLLATSCEHGTLHFNDDFLYIEKKYIDEEKKRFHPVITDLLRTSQPIIRYELNDIIHEKEDCPCESSFTAIEKIEGRSDDVLIFQTPQTKEIRIYPDFIRRTIILAHPSIRNFTIVQKSNSLMELYLEQDEYFDLVEKRLLEFLTSQGINGVQISQTNSKNHKQGNKLRRVQNDKQK